MKKIIGSASLTILSFSAFATGVFAQNSTTSSSGVGDALGNILKPNTDVVNNPAFRPVAALIGNIIFLLMILVVVGAVSSLATNAYKYSTSGDDLNAKTNSKAAMKNSLLGLAVGLGSILIVTAVIFMLKQTGIFTF